VRLVTSDKCLGIVEAAAGVFPEAQWQRCVVHFERNILIHDPASCVYSVLDRIRNPPRAAL